jgi:predicted RNA binding protein YcfA (HicA-like mRNA interferase family)
MNKLPSGTSKELIAALGKIGFQVIRVKGSHLSYATKKDACSVENAAPPKKSFPALPYPGFLSHKVARQTSGPLMDLNSWTGR